jgi:conjugal transfer pilus assembly protein TraB
LSTDLKQVAERLKQTEQENTALRKQMETSAKPGNAAAAMLPPPPLPPRPASLPAPPPHTAAGARGNAAPPGPPPVRIVSVDLLDAGAPGAARLPGAPPGSQPAPAAQPHSGTLHKTSLGLGGSDTGAPGAAEYLPTSSFVAANNLNGALAPTGGAAQKSPVPMVFRITDHAVLPNHVRGRIKDCFAQAAAHGELGAERVHVRLTRFSCVEKSGRTIDLAVKGYVVGEDGIEGMAGTVITKQGQAIANALLAGVASGIGRGFQSSATETSVSALGRVDSTKSGHEFQYGLAQGASTALDRLAKYYLDLADQMHPVIEVGALRKVTLVFAQGVSMAAGDEP